MKAYLILEDGNVFEGESVGADKEVVSEFVFNTSMTGYVEVLTDPSYAGQSVVMTYPLIGNYGVCLEDQESTKPYVEGFVVNELARLGSNFRKNIDLKDYLYPGQYNPYTWEGCVVKMSDKIAYLARDIEDALRLNIIDEQLVEDLRNHLNQLTKSHFDAINNGTIVNYFILDVCQNSSIEKGICLSDEAFEVMKYIMKFNYQNIYLIDRIEVHTNYVQLILNSIFQFLYKYDKIANDNQINVLEALKKDQKKYPVTIQGYMHWLEKYSQMKHFNRNPLYQNHIIYDFEHDKNAMAKSIIDYLSGMSDAYILKIFNEFISFS